MRDTAFELFCEVQLYQSVGIQMPVLVYTSFLRASGVLTPQTDRFAELTPKNVRLQRGARTRRRCPTRRSERAEEHRCLSRTVTLWSNIFNLASFRMSVNQRARPVLDADDSDSSANERGALVLASAVLDLAPTAASFSVLGFVSCLSDVDL